MGNQDLGLGEILVTALSPKMDLGSNSKGFRAELCLALALGLGRVINIIIISEVYLPLISPPCIEFLIFCKFFSVLVLFLQTPDPFKEAPTRHGSSSFPPPTKYMLVE